MSQITRKWIQDSAINHTKLDSSDSYTMVGLTLTGPFIAPDSTIGNMYVSGTLGVGTDATAPNQLFQIAKSVNDQVGLNIQNTRAMGGRASYNITAYQDILTIRDDLHGVDRAYFSADPAFQVAGNFQATDGTFDTVTVPILKNSGNLNVGATNIISSSTGDTTVSANGNVTVACAYGGSANLTSFGTANVSGNVGVLITADAGPVTVQSGGFNPLYLFGADGLRMDTTGTMEIVSVGDIFFNAIDSTLSLAGNQQQLISGSLLISAGNKIELSSLADSTLSSLMGNAHIKSGNTTKMEGITAYVSLDNDAYVSGMNATVSAGEVQIGGNNLARLSSASGDTSVFANSTLDIGGSTIYINAPNNIEIGTGEFKLATGTGTLTSKYASSAYIIESSNAPLQVKTLANQDMTAWAQGGLRLWSVGKTMNLDSGVDINLTASNNINMYGSGSYLTMTNAMTTVANSSNSTLITAGQDTTVAAGGYINLTSAGGILINSANKNNGLIAVQSSTSERGLFSWAVGANAVGVYVQASSGGDRTAIYTEAQATSVALEIGTGKIIVSGNEGDTTAVSFLDAGSVAHTLNFTKGILTSVT